MPTTRRRVAGVHEVRDSVQPAASDGRRAFRESGATRQASKRFGGGTETHGRREGRASSCKAWSDHRSRRRIKALEPRLHAPIERCTRAEETAGGQALAVMQGLLLKSEILRRVRANRETVRKHSEAGPRERTQLHLRREVHGRTSHPQGGQRVFGRQRGNDSNPVWHGVQEPWGPTSRKPSRW